MTKTVYSYTGQKKVLDDSDLCPISKKWLIPAGYTATAPLKNKTGYSQEYDPKKKSWSYKKIESSKDETSTNVSTPLTDTSTANTSKTLQKAIQQRISDKDKTTTAEELRTQIASLAQMLSDMQTKLAVIS